MAVLTNDQKKFIMVRQAMYDRNGEIIKAFEVEFDIKLDKTQINSYMMTDDGKPRHGRNIAKELVKLHNETRKAYLEEMNAIPIANRSHRLKELNELYYAAKDSDDLEQATKILETAAKEVGDAFTNRQKFEGAMQHTHEGTIDFAIAEKRAVLVDSMRKALEQKPVITAH